MRFGPGFWFIAPCLAALAVTSLYPLGYGIVLSFFEWNWGARFAFAGLANYVELFGSAEFWRVLYNTVYFAFFACAIEIALGYYLAVQVDKIGFAKGLVRTLLLTPLMISGIIVALMSKVMFDPFLGVVNYLMAQVGLGPSAFYGAASTAMWTVIGVDVWWQTAFVFIIMLAGLQGLPRDPMDAARLEGASDFAIFWRIKFPLLRPLLYTVIVFRSIDTLKVFDIIFGTTGGGPALSTEAAQTLAYRTAFSYLQIGKSMTIMVVFSMIILGICVLYSRLQTAEERAAAA